MSFTDSDPIEDDMSVRCEQMTPDQLVSYVQSWLAAYNVVMKIDGLKERMVFKGMQRIYGQQDAGRIVKWAFYKYRGRYGDDVITCFSFSKGRKWWVDKMHIEMQQHLASLAPKTPEQISIGAASLSDL